MSNDDFDSLQKVVKKAFGILLNTARREMFSSRLWQRMQQLEFSTYQDYLNHLDEKRSYEELQFVVDAVTNHTTYFFREPAHYEFLIEKVFPKLFIEEQIIRIWSAGCATGEEPYSIAISSLEANSVLSPDRVRILATDISETTLSEAALGGYDSERLKVLPQEYLNKYIRLSPNHGRKCCWAKESVKRLVTFGVLNLISPKFPLPGLMNVIFCRNVMIYFDRPTQETLIGKFVDQLVSGGYLIISMTESLTAATFGLRYVEPGIYRKA